MIGSVLRLVRQVREAAQHMAARMAQEPEGTQAAVDSFHRWGLP